jgi:hypothetical protein
MRARMIALVAVAGLLIGGCGSGASQRRTQVAQYIQQAGQIESALAAPLGTVTRASNQFTHAGPSTAGSAATLARIEHDLVGALHQIRALGSRLAAIAPPSEARHLRALLLDVARREAEMTREVAMLVDYLPRFSAALVPLPQATKRLSAALSQTTPSAYGAAGVAAVFASKAAALTQFQSDVRGVESRLRQLQPPPVSTPAYTAQLTTLERMRTTAGRLATALAAQDRARIPTLLDDFNAAAVANRSIAAQQAQIAAVKAYDRRAREIDRLAVQVQAERIRLSTKVK